MGCFIQWLGTSHLQPHSGGLQGSLLSGRNAWPSAHRAITVYGRLFLQNPYERYLTGDEAQRLMRALEKSDRLEVFALRLLLLTGARKSEVLKARWEHVRPNQRLLTVPLSKSGKPRHISLFDEAIAVIRAIPWVPGCPWLFPGHAPDKPLSDIYQFWNKVRRGLGLTDVRIHDLRHTFASLLVNAGHSRYEVQKLLGTAIPARPCVTPIWGRHHWWLQRKP